MLAVVLVVGTFVWVAYGFINLAPYNSNIVQRYCEYGAVSNAQLDGCIDHVTENDVRERDTPAARYALHNLSDCLEDSGPFCKTDEEFAYNRANP